MSRAVCVVTVRDSRGNVREGVDVEFFEFDAVTGLGAPATLFAGPDGAGELPNPSASSVLGKVAVWLERGAYAWTADDGENVTDPEQFMATPAWDGSVDEAWADEEMATDEEVEAEAGVQQEALDAEVERATLAEAAVAAAVVQEAADRTDADELLAPLASPEFTGNPKAPTPAPGDNDTSIATTAHVRAAIDAVIAGAPGALDTLNEIATQLADDEDAVAALTLVLATKAPLDSAALTGVPSAPTPGPGDTTTKIATTAFVAVAAAAAVVAGAAALVTLAPAASARNVVQPTGAAVVALVVKGFAGQTANVQEWQNSAGAVLGRVNAAGELHGTSLSSQAYVVASSNLHLRSASSYISFGAGDDVQLQRTAADELTIPDRVVQVSPAAATVASVVRGFASQSADLQQWQDSTSAVKAAVSSSGQIHWGATGRIYPLDGFVTRIATHVNVESQLTVGATGSLAQATIYTGAANRVGVVNRAAAAQTANQQEWQNSAGSVLASIDSTGAKLTLGAGGILAGTMDLGGLPGTISAGGVTVWQVSAGTDTVRFGHFAKRVSVAAGSAPITTPAAMVQVVCDATTAVGQTIKGAVSQTADLLKLQNSGGTDVLSVTSLGTMAIAGNFTAVGSAIASAFRAITAAPGTAVWLRTNVGGEAAMRWQVDGNGLLEWGPGGVAAMDVSLRREAAGVLGIPQAGGGLKLKSPDGLTTKTLTIDNAGALALV